MADRALRAGLRDCAYRPIPEVSGSVWRGRIEHELGHLFGSRSRQVYLAHIDASPLAASVFGAAAFCVALHELRFDVLTRIRVAPRRAICTRMVFVRGESLLLSCNHLSLREVKRSKGVVRWSLR